jgi:hypothetical protein
MRRNIAPRVAPRYVAETLPVLLPGAGYTLDDLKSIQQAIASGASKVQYESKTVEYRSLDELMRLEHIIMGQLGLLGGVSATYLAGYSRGYVSGGDDE